MRQSMDGTFEKYPNIEIISDAFDPMYKIRYTECVKEDGVIRFFRHERKIPRKSLENMVSNLIALVATNGK